VSRRYATSCDVNYLPRLKVLFASMQRHCRPFDLSVLCADRETYRWCLEQSEISPVLVDDFLRREWHLGLDYLPGPRRRNRIDEQLCTWRWWFVVRLLEEGDGPVTSIDVDTMFWSDPSPLFAEIGAAPMAVNPHAIPLMSEGIPGVSVETHGAFGLYNGGFVYFAELAPARRMALYVYEWCYPGLRTHPDGRLTYGDQGYLELVLEKFGGHVITHPGVNAAPWNLNRRPPKATHDGAVFIGGRRLIFFHYQGYTPELRSHVEYCTTEEHDRILYVPYRAELARIADAG